VAPETQPQSLLQEADRIIRLHQKCSNLEGGARMESQELYEMLLLVEYLPGLIQHLQEHAVYLETTVPDQAEKIRALVTKLEEILSHEKRTRQRNRLGILRTERERIQAEIDRITGPNRP
jgi:hypothetical protein